MASNASKRDTLDSIFSIAARAGQPKATATRTLASSQNKRLTPANQSASASANRNTGISLAVKAVSNRGGGQVSNRAGPMSNRAGQTSNRAGTSNRPMKKIQAPTRAGSASTSQASNRSPPTSSTSPPQLSNRSPPSLKTSSASSSTTPPQLSNRSPPSLKSSSASRLSHRAKTSVDGDNLNRRGPAASTSSKSPQPPMAVLQEEGPRVTESTSTAAAVEHRSASLPSQSIAPSTEVLTPTLAVIGTPPSPPSPSPPTSASLAEVSTAQQMPDVAVQPQDLLLLGGAAGSNEFGTDSSRRRLQLKSPLPDSARGTPKASPLPSPLGSAPGSSNRRADQRENLTTDEPTAEQLRAATKIEALMRGRSGRLKLVPRKQKLKAALSFAAPTSEQQRAATKIEALVRGRSGRLHLEPRRQKLKPALPLAPPRSPPVGGTVSKDAGSASSAIPEASSPDEQLRREAAATKIEALLRGKASRSGRLRLEARRGDAAANEPRPPSIEELRAATLIEKIARGHSGRLHLAEKAANKPKSPSIEELRAATLIEKIARGHSGRLRVANASPIAAAAAKAAVASGARATAVTPQAVAVVQPSAFRTSRELRQQAAALLILAEEKRVRIHVIQNDSSLLNRLGGAILKRGMTVGELITEWDRNKDGQISKIEFKQAIRNSLSISATNPEIDALFARIDADGGERHARSVCFCCFCCVHLRTATPRPAHPSTLTPPLRFSLQAEPSTSLSSRLLSGQ